METKGRLCNNYNHGNIKVESNRGFIGRVGNTVTYVLNGQIVKRTIGKSSREATIPQLQQGKN